MWWRTTHALQKQSHFPTSFYIHTNTKKVLFLHNLPFKNRCICALFSQSWTFPVHKKVFVSCSVREMISLARFISFSWQPNIKKTQWEITDWWDMQGGIKFLLSFSQKMAQQYVGGVVWVSDWINFFLYFVINVVSHHICIYS